MYDKAIQQRIAEFTKQTNEEQITFMNSFKRADPELIVFSVYKKPKTKQQMFKEIKKEQHKSRNWFRKFENKKGY